MKWNLITVIFESIALWLVVIFRADIDCRFVLAAWKITWCQSSKNETYSVSNVILVRRISSIHHWHLVFMTIFVNIHLTSASPNKIETIRSRTWNCIAKFSNCLLMDAECCNINAISTAKQSSQKKFADHELSWSIRTNFIFFKESVDLLNL